MRFTQPFIHSFIHSGCITYIYIYLLRCVNCVCGGGAQHLVVLRCCCCLSRGVSCLMRTSSSTRANPSRHSSKWASPSVHPHHHPTPLYIYIIIIIINNLMPFHRQKRSRRCLKADCVRGGRHTRDREQREESNLLLIRKWHCYIDGVCVLCLQSFPFL